MKGYFTLFVPENRIQGAAMKAPDLKNERYFEGLAAAAHHPKESMSKQKLHHHCLGFG